MVNQNWHETGNGGYSQEEPVATTPAFYSTMQKAREKRIHKEAIIIIGHDHRYQDSDFVKMKKGGVTAKVLKLTTDGIDWKDGKRYEVPGLTGWTTRYLSAMNGVYQIAEDEDSDLMIIRTVADIYEAKKQNKAGAILGSEGARQLEGDISLLSDFYKRGTREIQIFWPAGNQLFSKGHLTEFGRQVIKECNRLGILVDLSHVKQAGESAFWEALKESDAPVIVSHDSPGTIGGGECNDDMIRGIAESGGGYGVYALHFVTPIYIFNQTDRNLLATADDLATYIDYVVRLVGIDHVALGADWFDESGYNWVVDITEMLNITQALIKKSYSDEDIKKILGGNMLCLFEHVWKD